MTGKALGRGRLQMTFFIPALTGSCARLWHVKWPTNVQGGLCRCSYVSRSAERDALPLPPTGVSRRRKTRLSFTFTATPTRGRCGLERRRFYATIGKSSGRPRTISLEPKVSSWISRGLSALRQKQASLSGVPLGLWTTSSDSVQRWIRVSASARKLAYHG